MRTFRLPDLGEGLTEAEVVAWHVAAGDRVVADQPLVSVETDKAVIEIPAPWSGIIKATFGTVGEVVAIGAPLAQIDTGNATAVSDAGSVVGSLSHGGDVPPQGSSRQVLLAASREAQGASASPVVRKRARELGIDLATVNGTGPGGAVTLADLSRSADHARPHEQRRPPEGYAALSGVRRAMAQAMAATGAQIVPATVTDEAVVEHWTAKTDPTVRLARAVVAGCQAAPELNAWFDARSQSRRLLTNVDLGIAMETADGLFVPVLRDVGARVDADLRAGLEAMKRDVAARSVPLAELKGQTITLSNFGMLGGLNAALTIMTPQVAILGAGRMQRAVRAIGDEMRIVRVLPLSLTFDHRAVTGAEAMRFLNAVIGSLSA